MLAPREVQREQQLTLQALDQQREDPLQLALAKLRRLLYGHGGYGHAPLGVNRAEVAALTPNQLRQAHQGWGGSAMVIAAAGHLDEGATAHLTALAEDLTPCPGSSPPMPPPAALPTAATMAFHPQDTEQVALLLGAATCGLTHQDQAVLRLLQCHLGAGMSARLPQVIRETHGLAYEVGALFPVRQQSAPFIVHLSTSRERAALALELLLAEWRRGPGTPPHARGPGLAPAQLHGAGVAAVQN
ncbi:MAG TPA: insulinase family protein, partial [Synechococcus sp. UBA8638]|nr:insulinase family protein [Synechococcus sp. UBA8638]